MPNCESGIESATEKVVLDALLRKHFKRLTEKVALNA